ncbi:MAG: hypothetical protein FJ160_04795 [Gammaproteobacteria bacterium]|nr:hypothetical protein [Gammaproteobacteria bacterium]
MTTPTTLPTLMLLPQRAASLGEILDAGFGLYRRSLAACLPLSLLAVLLGQLPSAYLQSTGQSLALDRAKDISWWLLMILAAVGTLWCWLVLMLRQRASLRREAKSLQSLVTDLRQALRLLPHALATLALALMAVVLGLLLLVIPGIYLLIGFWPALALVVFESAGPRAALDGALQLARGHWRHLAATLVVVAMTVFGLFVIGSLLGLAFIELADGWPAASIVTTMLGALFQPLLIALGITVYADLRHRRDQIPASASSSA